MKIKAEFLDEANAQVLAELVVDSQTGEHLKVQIINKLVEARENQTFFQTIFEENLSLGNCPHCDHENHWLIPENDLNEMGHVTSAVDLEVPETTTEENCPEFAESCLKKKITM